MLKESNLLSFTFLDGQPKETLETVKEPLQLLTQLLQKVKDYLNICKSDLLIKYVTLLSYPKYFPFTNYDIMFIQTSTIPALIKNKKLFQYVDRDSFIYSSISNKNNSVIFIYQLFKQIITNVDTYINEDSEVTDMIHLLKTAVTDDNSNLKSIETLYKKLKGNPIALNDAYGKLQNNKKQISTFIKYRKDTGTVNPRYNVFLSKDNLLLINYANTDGVKGNFPSYNRDTAVSQLNDESVPKELYILGNHKVYTTETAKQVAGDIEVSRLLEHVTAKEGAKDLCIIGYGQSGSGKTSILIYFSIGKEDGILMELCKLPAFTEVFNKITITLKNIYTHHWMDRDDYNKYEDYEYKIKSIGDEGVFGWSEYSDSVKNNWKLKSNDEISLAEFINNAFNEREVESTTNNPNSSRSHVLCCLTCSRKDGLPDRHIVICDLAGVENKFAINVQEILKFDLRYQESDKYQNNDIPFDSFFCKQYDEDEKAKDGGYDSDGNSSVSSYSTTSTTDSDSTYSSSSSVSSDNSSVSSLDSTEDDGDGNNDVNDNMRYEETDGYKIDLREIEDLMMDGSFNGVGDKPYGLEKYKYGSYDDESKSAILKEHEDLNMRKDYIIETEPDFEETYQKGQCQPRYLLNFCNKLDLSDQDMIIDRTLFSPEELKQSPDDIAIQSIQRKLSQSLNDILPQMRYWKNMLAMMNATSIEYDGKSKKYKAGHKKYYSSMIDKIVALFEDKSSPSNIKRVDEVPKELRKKTTKSNDYMVSLKDYITYAKNKDSILLLAVHLHYDEIADGKDKFAKTIGTRISDMSSILKTEVNEKYGKHWLSNFSYIRIFLQSKYNEIKTEMNRRFCNKHRFNKLLFNIKLRINEGMMINHSLSKLREDLKSIMLNSVSLNDSKSGKTYLPLMFDTSISPAIRNTYIEDEYYDRFLTQETKLRETKGIIMKIIKDDFKVDINSMYIAIFTVINLTDSDKKAINNPPNPPYINISELIYTLPVAQGGMSTLDRKRVLSVYKTMLNKTKNYDFYKTNPVLLKLIEDVDKITNKDEFESTVYNSHIKKYIELIQQNNPSTLIGSIESTDIIKNFTFDKIVAYYNEKINDMAWKKYIKFGLEYFNQDTRQVNDPKEIDYAMESNKLIRVLEK